MIRRLAIAAGALLGGFHVWLLLAQVSSGHLADPTVLARWLLAVALGAGLVALHRRGLPLVAGRQAVAVWLLAALLHGPALANDHDGFAMPALPEAVATVAQAAAAVSALGLALLALYVLEGAFARGDAAPALLYEQGVRLRLDPRRTPGFLPRPPPRS